MTKKKKVSNAIFSEILATLNSMFDTDLLYWRWYFSLLLGWWWPVWLLVLRLLRLWVWSWTRYKKRKFQAFTKPVGGMSGDVFPATSLKESHLQMMHHLIVLSESKRNPLLSKTASISSTDKLRTAVFSCCAFQLGYPPNDFRNNSNHLVDIQEQFKIVGDSRLIQVKELFTETWRKRGSLTLNIPKNLLL